MTDKTKQLKRTLEGEKPKGCGGLCPRAKKKEELADRRKRLDNFNKALNKQPPKDMIRVNARAHGAQYLPISYLELELNRLFLEGWSYSITQIIDTPEGVGVAVKLEVIHPVTNKVLFFPGVGYKATLSKGQPNPRLKESFLPAAKAEALKNACKSLGRRFGRDLNRTEGLREYTSYYDQFSKPKPKPKVEDKAEAPASKSNDFKPTLFNNETKNNEKA